MQYAAYCLKTGESFIREEFIAELFGFRRLNAADFTAGSVFAGSAKYVLSPTGFREAWL